MSPDGLEIIAYESAMLLPVFLVTYAPYGVVNTNRPSGPVLREWFLFRPEGISRFRHLRVPFPLLSSLSSSSSFSFFGTFNRILFLSAT